MAAEKRAERDAEEQLKAEAWEREAPQRERQRLADEAKEREKRFDNCELGITHYPKQNDFLMCTMLSPENADFKTVLQESNAASG